MKKLIAFSFVFLALAQIHAESRVWSRSIMPSCEFVYQVESDVKVRLPEPYGSQELLLKVPLYLRAKFKNSWDQSPQLSETFLVKLNKDSEAVFSFESMSVSKGYLFREMYFQWVYEHEAGYFVALSPIEKSDVGRQMGEACYTDRYSEEQYSERIVGWK